MELQFYIVIYFHIKEIYWAMLESFVIKTSIFVTRLLGTKFDCTSELMSKIMQGKTSQISLNYYYFFCF